jgi:hypothetical protein
MLAELHLSPWAQWSERHLQPDCAGVYIIGKGAEHSTIYIGRTWGKGGLRDRLRAFHRSAVTGQKGHAGGMTYHHAFGSDVDDLSVRAHVPITINPDNRILRPYIDYAERRLIWEYVARHGDLPVCNTE